MIKRIIGIARRCGLARTASGRPYRVNAVEVDPVELARSTFCGLTLLNGHDPFSGERGLCVPLGKVAESAEKRDTS
jgi:hypothetical protein